MTKQEMMKEFNTVDNKLDELYETLKNPCRSKQVKALETRLEELKTLLFDNFGIYWYNVA